MRVVAITDGGAGAIWFFGFFVLVAVLGFAVIVFKGMGSAAGGRDADRGLVMKIAGIWLVGSAAFVAGFLMFWGELSEIHIEDDGTWALRNAVGFELGAIGGGVERSVELQWLTPDEIDHHEGLSPHQPAELTVQPVGGEVFEVYIDAGAAGVLERLGYAPGGPCADPKNPQEFPRHTFTKRGPWCPRPERLKPAAKQGEPVFALWSKDGWWYPARAVRSEAGRAEVAYADGSKEWRKKRAEFGARALPSVAHLQADWEGKGKYFPCVVEGELAAGRYAVEYADGSKEEVSDERLRFQLPKPDDLVFAASDKDGWWYSSAVVGASIDGLLVRPSGHAADESKSWQQVLPLQLPVGTKVEVGGKAAVVVAHAGTRAKVRFTADKTETMVAVGELRFRPFKS